MSKTNGERLWTPPTRTKTSKQENSDLTASNSLTASNRRTPATPPKAFHEESGRMLSRGRQKVCRRFCHTPKISQNCWKVKISSVVLCPGRKPHWISIQLRYNYFVASFFEAHYIHFSWEAKERYSHKVGTFTPVYLCVYGADHPILPIFRCSLWTSSHLTHTSQPINSSIQGFEHAR